MQGAGQGVVLVLGGAVRTATALPAQLDRGHADIKRIELELARPAERSRLQVRVGGEMRASPSTDAARGWIASSTR